MLAEKVTFLDARRYDRFSHASRTDPRIAFEKALDGMVIRFIAKFPCDDSHDLAGVNRGIKLLHIPHILGHSRRIDVAFASGMSVSLTGATGRGANT
jgi:hypothetical protein